MQLLVHPIKQRVSLSWFNVFEWSRMLGWDITSHRVGWVGVVLWILTKAKSNEDEDKCKLSFISGERGSGIILISVIYISIYQSSTFYWMQFLWVQNGSVTKFYSFPGIQNNRVLIQRYKQMCLSCTCTNCTTCSGTRGNKTKLVFFHFIGSFTFQKVYGITALYDLTCCIFVSKRIPNIQNVVLDEMESNIVENIGLVLALFRVVLHQYLVLLAQYF